MFGLLKNIIEKIILLLSSYRLIAPCQLHHWHFMKCPCKYSMCILYTNPSKSTHEFKFKFIESVC